MGAKKCVCPEIALHHRLVHVNDPSRATTIAMHKGEDVPRRTLIDIIEQAGLSIDEFLDLL